MSVETRRRTPQSDDSYIDARGISPNEHGTSSPRRKSNWSYFVFCQELQTLLERGREGPAFGRVVTIP
jgi:hypothetical protein